MTDTIETKTEPKKSSAAKPLLFIGIGCLVIIVLIGIGLAVGAKFLFSNVGGSMLKGVIEKNTGVKMDLDELKEGKATFTDSKTGETVSMGSTELPKTFPKDFPLYPSAKVAGSVAGGSNDTQGFWVTLTTPASVKDVTTYYETELAKNGYKITNTANMGKLITLTFEKGNDEGGVTITGADENAKDTTIVIAFGHKSGNTMQETPDAMPETDVTE